MKKAFLSLTIVLLLLTFSVYVSAADDYYVYNPIQLDGYVTVGGGLSIENSTLVDDGKLYISIESTKTGASNNSQTVITINPTGFAPEVKAKEYPVIKISYRSNIAAAAQITANIGVDYLYNGTVSPAKFFTEFLNFNRTFTTSSFMYNYKDCTSGEIVTPFDRIANFSVNNVTDDSIYNFIYLKPYVSNLNMVEGEHFDIEYVGFFKTVADAEAYEHNLDIDNLPLYDIVLREQVMRITKGDTFKLTVNAKPSFVPISTNVQYTSSNSNVATVDGNGKVTAVSAGTATITAKSGELESTCKFYVLDKDLAPLELYPVDSEGDHDEIIVNSIGDSITTYVPAPNGSMPYHKYWSQWYNITNNNYGVSGTTVAPRSGRTDSFIERYRGMRDDADLVTVKGGTNDWGSSFATGTLNDREATTYMGSIRTLMEGLIEKYPNSQIVFFTPIKRCEGGQTPATTNGKGATLNDYANALIELGAIYGIPVINLYTPEELDFTSPVITPPGTDESGKWHDAVCESDLMPDGLHPSGKGQKIMAEYMMEQMIKLGIFNDNSPKTPGDVDSDGDVSSIDWVFLSRSIAGWSGYDINKNAADIDGSGIVDTLDAIALARHLANWKGYETIPLK